MLTSLVHAHSIGEGYLFLKIINQNVTGRLELTLSDLNDAVHMDNNKDGKVSDQELDEKIGLVKAYISERLKFSIEENESPYFYTSHEIRRAGGAKYLMVNFMLKPWQTEPRVLGIEYHILFDSDPNQRGLLVIEENTIAGIVNNEEQVSLIFNPKQPKQDLDLSGSSWIKQFIIFIGQGIRHILIGIDHILFIIALILVSVVTRKEGEWQAASSFKPAFFNLVKIVTVFTIAHSITLGLAAFGIVQLTSRVVESVIAASVVAAALNNLVFIFKGRYWVILFCFGLFHGLGFASVLGQLIYSKQSLVVALFGFNIGVEIGQLAIVCLSFPVFYLLRNTIIYKPLFIRAGSITIGAIALLWFIERAFEIDLTQWIT